MRGSRAASKRARVTASRIHSRAGSEPGSEQVEHGLFGDTTAQDVVLGRVEMFAPQRGGAGSVLGHDELDQLVVSPVTVLVRLRRGLLLGLLLHRFPGDLVDDVP